MHVIWKMGTSCMVHLFLEYIDEKCKKQKQVVKFKQILD